MTSETKTRAPEHLAQPLTLRSGVTLPNRIGKAALSEQLGDRRTGAPTERWIRLFERWGRSGAGMLLTGNVMVDREHREALGNVVVTDERDLPALRRFAEAAQREGSKLFMQINHPGRQTPRRVTHHPVAPSAGEGVHMVGGVFAPPRELTEPEILEIIEKFAATAAVAKAAGFAGVQVHSAHGYLSSQFLSPLTNRRSDGWGGDAERRRRFLIEVVRAVRARAGDGFAISVKLNSADFQRGGFTEEESLQVVRALEAEGIDLLEVSGGSYESPTMFEGRDPSKVSDRTLAREAYFLEYARRVREVTSLPIMLTGGLRTAEVMEQVVADGAVDVVGLGRPMIVEPDLPRRVLAGEVEAALPVKLSVGIRQLDTGLQGLWYQRQIWRLADGLEPKLTLGRWSSILLGFLRTYGYSPLGRLAAVFSRKRRPPAAAAAASLAAAGEPR